ncbi:MAG: DUF4469 domain-containing protein [Treponema sp.]|jgi:hypothetical protein|nr:DUF4469 domain-containing protein [Treponema sp.]
MAVINDVTEVLHRIRVKLYPNYLGKGEGAYIARSKAEAPLSIEEICAAAKNRGGFTGQYEDLVEHTHIFVNEMIYQLLDGFSAQIGGFFSLHTKLGGTYHTERDRIDPSKISISFRLLTRFKELLTKIEVENEGLAGDGAYIDEIVDAHSAALNSVLTPGGMLHITGHKIKVEGDEADCGVWFVAEADGARTKVSENLGLNRATEVIAQIPALSVGAYRLEIVTRHSHGTLLKEPRTIKAEPELSVA